MIDTDKYEGHTPAPWKAIDDSPKVTAGTGPFEGEGAREHESWWVELNEARCISYGGEGQWQRRIGATYMTMRDAKLVADAPLLLAEVKRLREELDKQMEYIEWLEEFAPKAGEYNTSWDAYELAMGIHWTQMEEE